MTKRLAIFLVSLLALGFAVAGCGDDEKDKAKDSAPAADTASSEADTGAADEKGNDAPTPAANLKQAVEACKQSLNAQPTLSSAVKKELEDACNEAASGDEDGVRKATKKVCVRIIEESVPAGAARDQALKSCDQALNTP